MPPPEKLFVYEIAGRVHPPAALAGDGFLGLLGKGDYSYLFFSRCVEERVKNLENSR